MLRTLAFALLLGAPTLAAAEQFPQSASEQVVRGHDGAVLGRVAAVEYDEDGNIVAVEIPGLEPGSAPHAPSNLVAEERSSAAAQRAALVRTSASREIAGSNRAIRAR